MTNFTDKAKALKIEGFHIKGTRCFSGGNTYHKAYISAAINGKWVDLGETEQHYGYGDHYIVTAGDWLAENGFLNIENGYGISGWSARESNFITSSCDDVKRMKNL